MTRLRSPHLLLWGAIAAYAAAFSALSVLRHRAFQTGRFDLGNMVQAVWSTAHGHPLQITGLRGDEISRLAAHFDPILAAFAPLWLLWPSPDLLLVTQAVAIAWNALLGITRDAFAEVPKMPRAAFDPRSTAGSCS